MLLLPEDIRLNKQQLRAITGNPEKTASAARLVYVNDSQPGYSRVRRGKSFAYYFENRLLKDKEALERIRKLVIPPAWEQVWICCIENGHLQATGIDLKKRKQYRYHPLWNSLRNHTKFYRLYAFGKCIPRIREKIEADLSRKGLPLEKVLAAVICLMERTSIRVGSSFYEKLYGSFGLTTLKDNHVRIQGPEMRFMFRGKKGVFQNITLKNRRLASIVKACRDIPGKELFQYVDEQGEYKCVDSGMVNEYIRQISGGDFSAKDFRTWAGTVQALVALKKIGPWNDKKQLKSNVVRALDEVAAHLGNTRTVCRKYYVHPVLIDLYESGRLQKYLDTEPEDSCEPHDLHCEEKILLRILRKEATSRAL